MAATQFTENYKLGIYKPDDTYSSLDTFNNNMETIDTTMKAISTVANAAETGVGQSTASIEKLNMELETLNTSQAEQDTKILGLEQNYTAASALIEQNKSDISANTTAIANVKTQVDTNTQELQDLSGEVAELGTDLALPLPDATKEPITTIFENNINISYTYTATQDCYISISASINFPGSQVAGSRGTICINYNGIHMTYTDSSITSTNSVVTQWSSLNIPLKTGDKITFESVGSSIVTNISLRGVVYPIRKK